MRITRLHRVLSAVMALALAVAAPAPYVRAAAPGVKAKDLREVPIEDVTTGNKFALIVGAMRYTKTTPLEYSAADAQAMADFLIKTWSFPKENVHLMVDASPDEAMKPTYSNLLDQVDWLQKHTDENSDVVVFFSGHGVYQEGDYWLVPSDGTPKQVDRSCIAISKDIVNILKQKLPRRALMFFDACRNTKDKPDPSAQRKAPYSTFARLDLLEGSRQPSAAGRPYHRSFVCDTTPPVNLDPVEFTSCQPTERSLEVPDLGHGVFTYYLLRGLGDHDAAEQDTGDITFATLAKFVCQNVSQFVNKGGLGSQTPKPEGNILQRIVLRHLFDPPPPKEEQKKQDDAKQQILTKFNDNINNAYQSLNKGNFDEAMTFINPLTGLDNLFSELHLIRDNPDIHFIMGRCLCRRQKEPDYNAALKELQAAQTLKPSLVGLKEELDFVTDKLRPPTPVVEDPAVTIQKALDTARKGDLATAEAQAREMLAKDAPNPVKAKAHYILGLSIQNGKTDEETLRLAKAEYDQALQLDPSLALADSAKKAVLSQLNQIAVNAKKADADRLANEAERMADAGQYADAESRARQVLDNAGPGTKAPYVARSLYVLGRVAQNRNQYDEAIKNYNAAVDIDPTFEASVRDWRSKAQDERSQAAERAQLAAQAKDLYDSVTNNRMDGLEAKARALLAKNTGDDTVNAWAHYALGKVYHAAKDYESAIREYQTAYNLVPSLNEARSGEQQALKEKGITDTQQAIQTLVTELQQALKSGNLSEAETKARTLIATGTTDKAVLAQAHVALGLAATDRSQSDTAVQEYQTALLLDPGNGDAQKGLNAVQGEQDKHQAVELSNQAYGHLVHEEYIQAINNAQKALQKNDSDAMAHAVVGYALYGQSSSDDDPSVAKGNQEINEASQLDSTLPLVHAAYGLRAYNQWMTGLAQSSANPENDSFKKMEKELNQALSKDPQELLSLNALGVAYTQLGYMYLDKAMPKKAGQKIDGKLKDKAFSLFEKAAGYFTQVIKTDPRFSAAYYNLGNTYFNREKWPEAESSYRQAIAINGKNAAYHADLAAALFKQGKLPDAQAEAKQAQSLGLADHPIYDLLNMKH